MSKTRSETRETTRSAAGRRTRNREAAEVLRILEPRADDPRPIATAGIWKMGLETAPQTAAR